MFFLVSCWVQLFWYNLAQTFCNRRLTQEIILTIGTLSGVFQLVIYFIFTGSMWIPSLSIKCPRKLTCAWKKWHSLVFSFSPVPCSQLKSSLSLVTCSSRVLEKTTMSSKYNTRIFHCIHLSTFSIICWNVVGALVRPKGITLNSYKQCLVLKDVVHLSSSVMGTCQ